ncbi:MAG: sialidase family protein [Promethearchaeota archaeon]
MPILTFSGKLNQSNSAREMFYSEEIFEPFGCGPTKSDDINTPIGRGSNHGSNITEGPDAELIAVWYGGTSEKHEDVQIWMSKKESGSSGWSKPRVIEKEGRTSRIPPEMDEFKGRNSSEGNPVIYYEAEQERLHLWWITIYGFGSMRGWSTGFIKYKHSDDFGETWVLKEDRTPRLLHDFWGEMIKNHPIRLSNGDIILPAMTEWTSYSPVYYICKPEEFKKGCLESQWEKVRAPGIGCFQPTLVELEPGHILSLMRVEKNSKFNRFMAQQDSFDHGRSWTDAHVNDFGFPNCNANNDIVKLKNGHVVLIYNDSREIRNPLTAALSEDGAKTWPYKRNIDYSQDPAARFHYPSVIQTKDGLIHVTYSYQPHDNIKHAVFDEDWIKE